MRYLVATDGSTVSDVAVEYAARQTIAFDGTLVIAHVLTPDSELVDGTIVLPGEDAAVEEGERILEVAKTTAGDIATEQGAKLDIETELLTGRPAESVTRFADETGADAIYVGHRGLSEERERVVGSVAKSIVDKATIPVTVVR